MKKNQTVWGIFVGKRGVELEKLNMKKGPFPPEEGEEGYIAIGWPAVGDMNMYSDYSDYWEKFQIAYPICEHRTTEQEQAIQANTAWKFAKKMKKGDWVISPCSSQGVLLIGEVLGDYESDFHGEQGFARSKWIDLVHCRKVRWHRVFLKDDPLYNKLHKIGRRTLSKLSLSVDDLHTHISAQ